MSPFREKSEGGIFLSDKASGKYRPNIGVVISAAGVVYNPGDVVVVRPYDGYWLQPYHGKHYRTENEIRWYGLAHDMEENRTVTWDVHDQIVGWYDPLTRAVTPGPGYTLVQRDKRKFSVEVSVNVWSDEGEAISGTHHGRILFQAGHPDDLLHLQWTDAEDLWLVPDRCVLAKVTRDAD